MVALGVHVEASGHLRDHSGRPTVGPPTGRPEEGMAGARRAPVEDVSVVVLAGSGGPPLDDLLDALAASTVSPQRVLVSGLDPQGEGTATLLRHPLRTRDRVPVILRPAPAPTPGDGGTGATAQTWQVVEDARASLPVHPGHWLWVLPGDSRPEPGALAALAAAARRSSRVALVAPKLVRLEDPRLLVGVGHHLTAAGRVTDTGRTPSVDQGQLDLRQDVLGAPLAGSLLRSDVLEGVDGLDPAFGADGVEGLDLGWRVHLAGHRVVAAPDAVVRLGPQGLGVVDPRRTRVRQRQLALARGPVIASAWRSLGILVTSLAAAVVLLLVKRPRAAADELADVRAVLAPARGWGARWRFRRRRRVRPRDLQGLFVPRTSAWRTTLDTVRDALDPRGQERGSGAQVRPGAPGSAETGPVSEEFAELGQGGAAQRRWSWPLVTALVLAAALTVWRWQRTDLLGSLSPAASGVAGGELGPAATTSTGLWHSLTDGWRGAGLGHDQPAEPWLLPASALARLVEAFPVAAGATATAGVALTWLLFLAAPAGVLCAHLALRRATRLPWLRAALAVGWVGLAPLTAALAEGRVGPVVVHVLAPLLVAGLVVVATPARGVRRSAAAFATPLGVALAAAWVPVVLVASTLAGVLLAVVGRGPVRPRGAVLAVLPWLLLLPWLPALASGPVRLLGGAGATVAGERAPDVPAWQVLLLNPGSAVDASGWSGLLLWSTVPLWLGALAALLLPGASGRRAGILVGGAVVALALALLAPRLVLGELPVGYPDAGLLVTPWSGSLLSLCGAALLLAAALAADHLLAPAAGRRVPRLGLAAVVAGACVLALGWAPAILGASALVPAGEPLPAVAAEQARGPAALRTLVLRPADDVAPPGAAAAPPYRLAADLLGAEPEPARILRDRARDLAVGPRTETEVVTTVLAVTGDAPPAQAAERLHELGVGFVELRAPSTNPVAGLIDGVPGLTRVSSPEDRVLWRMAAPVSRVRVLGPQGEVLGRLAATGPHGTSAGRLEELPEGARLDVAEGSGWTSHARVLVDGVAVAPAADATVPLPTGTHAVEIDVRPAGRSWHLVALLLTAVTAFLALPFGRPEPERRVTA